MTTKKRKVDDERRVFKKEWTESYAFVSNPANGLPLCLICNEEISTKKKFNLERHFMTKHNNFANNYPAGDTRKTAIEELLQRHLQQVKSSIVCNRGKPTSNSITSTTTASFVVAQEIAKRGKPFTDGEYIKECFINIAEHLFSDFKNKKEIIKKIKDIPLSARTMKDRTIKMSTNITNQQINDIKLAPAFSVACDVDDTAQVCLFGRYVNSQGPQEELIALLPIKGLTCGEDIAFAVTEYLKQKEIDMDKLISVATGGATNSREAHKEFVSFFKRCVKHDIISFHCMIHQESFCAQLFPGEFMKVMNLVVQIVNKIMAKGSKHQQLSEFVLEIECHYSDVLLHNKVRWLSRGDVLKQFASCLNEIKTFLADKGITYLELTSHEWLQKFYFMVDMTTHLNVLNRKLQGKGNAAILFLEEVLSFEQKLSILLRDIETGALVYFETLKKYQQFNNCDVDLEFLANIVHKMQVAFVERFQELKREKATLMFLVNPLSADVFELKFSPFPLIDRAQFEMELADLKSQNSWSLKFRNLFLEIEKLDRQKCVLSSQHKWSEICKLTKQDQIIFDVWNCLPEAYSQLKYYAFGLLSIFGSTYCCEQAFSSMNFIKSKLRNQLTEGRLESCLKMKITTYSPNLEQLSKEMQQQKSH